MLININGKRLDGKLLCYNPREYGSIIRNVNYDLFRFVICKNTIEECSESIAIYKYICKNDVILSEEYSIHDLDIFIKCNIPVTLSYISGLCKYNKVKTLEYIKNKNMIEYCYDGLDVASCNGHISVLEWWKNSGLRLEYSINVLYSASINGHINVLEWWKNSGLPLEYNPSESTYFYMKRFDKIFESGKVNILEWWKNSGLKLYYSADSLDLASKNGHIDVLEWMKNSELECKYSMMALNLASGVGNIDVLDWWKNSGLPLKYSDIALIMASDNGHVDVLDWWSKSGLDFQNYKHVLVHIKEHPQKKISEWWRNSGFYDKIFKN
jgi:ankyrin repeat protein